MTLKIIDNSTLVPGPFTSYLLQKNLEASVTKIEDINQPDPLSFLRPTKDGIGIAYQEINKNKEIVKIDFHQNGSQKIKDLIKASDIFIENNKPGRTFKMGISFEDLVKENPKLVYVSIVGFPSDHPLSAKSTHDLNILALSGFLDQQYTLNHVTNPPPLVLADIFTAYYTANKIMSALIQKNTGIHLTISMWDAFNQAMSINNLPQLITQQDINTTDELMSGIYPCYHVYSTKDGLVAVAALEAPLWIDFCQHINRPDLASQQFEPSIINEIEKIIGTTSKSTWLDNDFCVTPVLSIIEAETLKYV